MLSINTNISSLITQSSMKSSTNALNQAIERMTTGYKINHAKDNAANYSISTNMTTKINSYMVAEDNAASALDMISTAEGTLDQIQDKLERLRALQEQASNGTYGEQSLKAINAEVNALVDEIERLYSTAEYNGIKLFKAEETQAIATFANARTTEKKFISDVTQCDTSAMTKLSTVDEKQILASGTYSISTAEELAKLATLANTGKLYDIDNKVAYGTYKFVLANDIDLKDYGNWTPIGGAVEDYDGDGDVDSGDSNYSSAFTGTFDGNGYAIKNMTMINKVGNPNSAENCYIALFGMAMDAEIKNLGVEDINIVNSGLYTAGILGYGIGVDISNVYTTGNVEGNFITSGISCYVVDCNLTDSYSTAAVSSTEYQDSEGVFYGGIACGLTGICYNGDGESGLENCFFAGRVEGDVMLDEGSLGALVVPLDYSVFGGASIGANNYYLDTWTTEENKLKLEELLVADGLDVSTLGISKTVEELEAMYGITLPRPTIVQPVSDITFQIGINSNSASQLTLNTGFILESLSDIRNIGLDTTNDYLTQLDTMLATVSAKQTEYGAASNRLESVLEEIQIQYDNLVSSRSTIRDADIAEVSSTYIQQQILQQAAATLMSTANQSPAIALQLI